MDKLLDVVYAKAKECGFDVLVNKDVVQGVCRNLYIEIFGKPINWQDSIQLTAIFIKDKIITLNACHDGKQYAVTSKECLSEKVSHKQHSVGISQDWLKCIAQELVDKFNFDFKGLKHSENKIYFSEGTVYAAEIFNFNKKDYIKIDAVDADCCYILPCIKEPYCLYFGHLFDKKDFFTDLDIITGLIYIDDERYIVFDPAMKQAVKPQQI